MLRTDTFLNRYDPEGNYIRGGCTRRNVLRAIKQAERDVERINAAIQQFKEEMAEGLFPLGQILTKLDVTEYRNAVV